MKLLKSGKTGKKIPSGMWDEVPSNLLPTRREGQNKIIDEK